MTKKISLEKNNKNIKEALNQSVNCNKTEQLFTHIKIGEKNEREQSKDNIKIEINQESLDKTVEIMTKELNKKYKKVDVLAGDNLENIVNKLLKDKENNILTYVDFNGIKLYSDTVTMDDAYRKVTGKTKSEVDKEKQKIMSTKHIYKYVLDVEEKQIVKIPSINGDLLSVKSIGNDIVIYALIDTSLESKNFEIRTYGTGFGVDDDILDFKFLGTVDMHNGTVVFHIFYKAI